MPDEKFDEKDREKNEEKTPDEKGWDEKWARDPLGAITWALIFIWAGVVLLLYNLGFFTTIFREQPLIPRFRFLAQTEVWAVILIGAGVIVLFEILIRLFIPAYRRAIGGNLFLAILLIGLGLANFIGWQVVGPLILIGLGLMIVLRGLFRQRE